MSDDVMARLDGPEFMAIWGMAHREMTTHLSTRADLQAAQEDLAAMTQRAERAEALLRLLLDGQNNPLARPVIWADIRAVLDQATEAQP